MPKGKKSCKKCGALCGARAYVCAECGSNFTFKDSVKTKKNKRFIKIDWKSLEKGDRIKVKGGPYYSNGQESISMGHKGSFMVESLDENGIRAFGVDKNSGFCHIYMGPDTYHNDTGIYKTKHKLTKLQKHQPSIT